MRKGRKHPGGKHHHGAAALFAQGATQALGPGGFASTFFFLAHLLLAFPDNRSSARFCFLWKSKEKIPEVSLFVVVVLAQKVAGLELWWLLCEVRAVAGFYLPYGRAQLCSMSLSSVQRNPRAAESSRSGFDPAVSMLSPLQRALRHPELHPREHQAFQTAVLQPTSSMSHSSAMHFNAAPTLLHGNPSNQNTKAINICMLTFVYL